jgi:hypothetical protein
VTRSTHEVVTELNDRAHHWALTVSARGDGRVMFHVGGEVFPLRRDGTRARRGKRPFFGGLYTDAAAALHDGLEALIQAEAG